jgi:transcription initiation factor TFIID subunit 2
MATPEVKAQRVELTIDTEEHAIRGCAHLRARPPPPARRPPAAHFPLPPPRLCRSTELDIVIPRGARALRLHAYGLDVAAVTLDGRPAAFTLRRADAGDEPPPQLPTAAAPARLAEAAAAHALARYRRAVEREGAPELEVALPAGAAGPAALRVEYSAARPAAGARFWGRFAATDAAPRRASAWLPCVDAPGQATAFALALTVRADETAVGPGRLARQAWADAARAWRTFHYEVPLPCSPGELGFAAGPFEVEAAAARPPPSGGPPAQLTAFAPRGAGAPGALRHLVGFAALPHSLYEGEALAARLPLASLQLAFVPPELARRPVATGVGLLLLSAELLVDPRAVEAAQEARGAIAGALARQWFGHLLRPAAPEDAWLVEGLAGWLEEQYVRRYVGRTDAAYRAWRRRQVVCAADNGDAPPLAPRPAPGASRSPWGALAGTYHLDPSPLWPLKAAAVVGMLERRAGAELFKKQVEALVAAAARPPAAEPAATAGTASGGAGASGAAAAPPPPPPPPARGARALDAFAFMSELGRAGDFRREVAAFAERWVYGRGAPAIVAGLAYHRRGSFLEVGMRQSGSEAARAGAAAAERAAAKDGLGTGTIKVAVREGSGTTVEHPVHAGDEGAVLVELKVNPEVKRIAGKRGRKRRDEIAQLAAQQAALANAQHPVQWVRLDPNGEVLCAARLLRPERMLLNQLDDSKDVVAQAEAVGELAELRDSPGALKALRGALEDAHLHPRVRADAAAGLAALRGDGEAHAGLAALLAFYHERYCEADAPGGADGAAGGGEGEEGEEAEYSARPIAFPDVAEYLVAQAVVTAVAACRGADGGAPEEAIDFLLDAAYHYVGGWAAHDDSGLLAALCHALGELRWPSDAEMAAHVCRSAANTLERHLARDLVAPSPAMAVGAACLFALVRLAGSGGCTPDTLRLVRTTIERCCAEPALPTPLRRAAHVAAMRLLAAHRGLGAALEHALDAGSAAAACGDAALAAAVWEEAVALAGSPAAAALGDFTAATLARVVERVSPGANADLRHLAFMALRRLARLPPTLYVPPSLYAFWADDNATLGPEQSFVPAATAVPAAPAPDVKVKLKVAVPGVTGATTAGAAAPAATVLSDGRAPDAAADTLGSPTSAAVPKGGLLAAVEPFAAPAAAPAAGPSQGTQQASAPGFLSPGAPTPAAPGEPTPMAVDAPPAASEPVAAAPKPSIKIKLKMRPKE